MTKDSVAPPDLTSPLESKGIAAAPPWQRREQTARGDGRLRQRSLVFIRWIAILGQLLALLVVKTLLDFQVPLVPLAAVIAASAAVNLFAALGQRGTVWLKDAEARAYLAFDLLQLVALLALTGGLHNPFALFMLAPVVVSAATLSQRSTLWLSLLAVSAATALAFWYLPLPWRAPGFELPVTFLAGIWSALVVAVLFIAAYVSSLASQARRMEEALSATRIALAREQRLSALGGLAAAAAHELGSPLGTIAVVAREMERELPAQMAEDNSLRQDVALLRAESDRCRRILTELLDLPDEDAAAFDRLPLSALLATAAQRFPRNGIEVVEQRHGDPEGAREPQVPNSPEMLHGLGTLIQNAVQFARRRVELETSWDAESASIAIRDDGPGFDASVLGDLGDPYLSTARARQGGGWATGMSGSGGDERIDVDHMGLGIFIAERLLAHSGGEIDFTNRPSGGAEVVIRWRRDTLETRN